MLFIHIVESTATGTLSMLTVLANSQASNGHSVKVIYSKRPETPDNLNLLFHADIELINLNMNTFFEKFASILILRKLYLKFNPDKILLHSSFAGFIGRLSTLGCKYRPFYIPHCISFMRKDIGVAKKLLFIAFEWIASIKPSVYVACSQSEMTQIKRYIPFSNCQLVENAIDTSSWNSDSSLIVPNTVLTVGQIRPQKNPQLFAEIAKSLTPLGFKFFWVGDGESEIDKQLLTESGVTILGWKSPKEVKTLLQKSQIFLSTSLWEGLPVSPLEAMLSGCTAILSNCAGNTDIIDNTYNGFIFNSKEECIDIFTSLLAEPSIIPFVSKNGIDRVSSHYCLERYISEFDALLK
jgi:glycosyltransferase involved in cell wall biosynthesis